jgi:hypothetical protein
MPLKAGHSRAFVKSVTLPDNIRLIDLLDPVIRLDVFDTETACSVQFAPLIIAIVTSSAIFAFCCSDRPD